MLIKRLLDFLKIKRPPPPPPPAVAVRPSVFTTDILDITPANRVMILQNALDNSIQISDASVHAVEPVKFATDSMDFSNIQDVKSQFAIARQVVPDLQYAWFAGHGFIGYQTCAVMAQHWLIDKCCTMPARDAVQNGFEITVNDGSDVSIEILDAIKKADVVYRLNENLVQFARMGRIFGVRIAMFKVKTEDPIAYYLNPFNPDGIMPGSYSGISQIDPYWITPELDMEAAADPSSIYFYEPTWWRVNGMRVHRTHLIIMRNGELTDILKPTYFYGGIPVPQKVYERVYAAERTANEAPLLALTKRSTIIHVNLAQVLANQAKAEARIAQWAYYRDNYGIKILDKEETAEQFDTSLSDLDAVIMTQYQIVAAAANVPAVKLLGTSPKGFNATGEHEQKSYHEELKSIQTHELTPLIERHHLLLIRSEISPNQPFTTTVVWNSVETPTQKEMAELNKSKADTGAVMVNAGIISPDEERERLINDPYSGFNGIPDMSVVSNPETSSYEEPEPHAEPYQLL